MNQALVVSAQQHQIIETDLATTSPMMYVMAIDENGYCRSPGSDNLRPESVERDAWVVG